MTDEVHQGSCMGPLPSSFFRYCHTAAKSYSMITVWILEIEFLAQKNIADLFMGSAKLQLCLRLHA